MRSFLAGSRGFLRSVALVVGLAGAVACSSAAEDVSSQSPELRSLTKEEALADFDQLTATFRGYYGALERKEARYGFRFDDLARDFRGRVERATGGDAEYQGIFVEFVSTFRDAHISLSPQFVGDSALVSDDSHSFRIPVYVMPVENTFVVYYVGAEAAGQVKIGDEVLAIDDVAPETLMQQYMKYSGTPNPLAARHFAAARLTGRSAYTAAGLRAGAPANLRLRGADGQERTATVSWTESAHAVPPLAATPRIGTSTPETMAALSPIADEVIHAELGRMGARTPFFMTEAVKAELNIQQVKPSEQALTASGVDAATAAKVAYFAGTYMLDGKKVLLVRIPDYMPQNMQAAFVWLAVLLQEQQPNVDALVVDQTHNSGGALFFAEAVASLLTPRAINNYVQQIHADRMWILQYASIADRVRPQNPQMADEILAQASKIDAAYSAHRPLTEPMPMLGGETTLQPEQEVHWTKPMLMLVDELAVSCGDIVPGLMKWNHVAPLFGQTTMGGGGNVEEVATLTNTRWTLNLSRGLGVIWDPTGAFPDATYIEDNGVTPDITYSHTLSDFRAGYVGYVRAFNAEISRQIAAAAAQP